jgi:hypothetical protein
MTPVAERSILTEPAPAELDLTGDLGYGGLDWIAGVVQDEDRTLNNDRTRGLERERDGRGSDGFVGHAKNIDGKR